MLLMLIWDFYLFAGKCEPRDRRAGDPINPNRIVARVSKSFPNGQQKWWGEINLGAGSGFTFSALIATSLILMRARFKFRKEILRRSGTSSTFAGFSDMSAALHVPKMWERVRERRKPEEQNI